MRDCSVEKRKKHVGAQTWASILQTTASQTYSKRTTNPEICKFYLFNGKKRKGLLRFLEKILRYANFKYLWANKLQKHCKQIKLRSLSHNKVNKHVLQKENMEKTLKVYSLQLNQR
jgi:hypothetical protein